ncbi:hypothetical protein M3666_12080 [Curtobacterium sp. ODYSSEY 48 V2]|uniref:hypothetical protein n=1 Tax=Curtobacterium sp. ODYSSEY 48 V2 TaxID=2939561 RepID=UPI00203CDBD4|nr:hypothetical protein [Curtobacterium sp. ODYSSEY 48 V2]MCM3505852.1 hypothetical protein [Curtobacterium sp. ODYSSEY 48 V2]
MAAFGNPFDDSVFQDDTRWSSFLDASTSVASIADRMTRAQQDLLNSSSITETVARINERNADQFARLARSVEESELLAGYKRDMDRLADFALQRPLISETKINALLANLDKTNLFAVEAAKRSLTPSIEKMLGDSSQLSAFAREFAARQPDLSATFAAAAFRRQTGTEADALGDLWQPVSRHDGVVSALDEVTSAIVGRGPFGVNFDAVGAGAEHLVVEISDLDREERAEIAAAAEVAGDATHTANPGTRDQLSVIGLDRFAQRYSTDVAIILAFTVGLTYSVLQFGSGNGDPGTFFSAAEYGAVTYGVVKKRLGR